MNGNITTDTTPAKRGQWPDSSEMEAAANRVATLARQLGWAANSLEMEKADSEALATMACDAAEAADVLADFAGAYVSARAAALGGGNHV
jgi:hypothetical protein